MTVDEAAAAHNTIGTGDPSLNRRGLPGAYLAALLSCVALTITVVCIYLLHEYQATLQDWKEKLSVIADSDATFVTRWLQTRQNEGENIAKRSDVISLLVRSYKTKAMGEAQLKLQSELDHAAQLNGYSAIYVIDPQGRTLASTREAAELPPDMIGALKFSPVFGLRILPQKSMAQLRARIALIIPVQAAARTVGSVLLLTRADHIYRLPSQELPTTRSGESFVLYVENNKVVIIGSPRNVANVPADSLLDPGRLAARTIWERRAVTGEEYDYRHIRTLVVTRFVPKASWGVITKMDRVEALASFYPLVVRASAVGLMIVLVLVAISLALWRQHQVDLLEAEIVRRNRVEQDLRQAEALFSKAFRSSPQPFTIATLYDGRFIEVNDAYLKMVGYERDELIGKTAADLQLWTDPTARSALVAKVLARGSTNEERVSYRTKSGSLLDLRISAEVIQLRGQPCLLVLSRDVTEQVLIDERMRQAQKMEALGRLAGGVAHDFNNLLGIIIGYSELLAKDMPVNALSGPRLEAIRTAAERAASLASQLLAFSRKQVLLPTVADLNSLVSETHEMLLRLIGENIHITTVLEPQLGFVKADPSQIVQVIINLSINARDAMPAGGELVIETANVDWSTGTVSRGISAPPGQYVMLSVRDTGTGMTTETQAQIFEPFFTTKPPGRGTGLGLATVSGIVEQSGGHLLVDSELGSGTTFKILLPRVYEDATSTPSQEDLSEGPVTGTVLLVEDEVGIRELIREYLATRGYTVLSAGSGREALDIAKEFQGTIDLLITDVIMSQMNGPTLAHAVQEQRAALKVLYMSGYTGDKLREAAISNSEITFIQKPFLLKDLGDKIRIVLGRNVTMRPVPSPKQF